MFMPGLYPAASGSLDADAIPGLHPEIDLSRQRAAVEAIPPRLARRIAVGTRLAPVGDDRHLRGGEELDFLHDAVAAAPAAPAPGVRAQAVLGDPHRVGMLHRLDGGVE